MVNGGLRLAVRVPVGGDGYLWKNLAWETEYEQHREGPVLFERPDRVFDSYAPEEKPIALYRLLADTDPTDDGVLRFANRFGRLKGDRAETFDIGDLPGGAASSTRFVQGEPLEEWVRVIEEMHEAVALWDMARSKNHRGLSEALAWREGCVFYLGTARYRKWRDADPMAMLEKFKDQKEARRLWEDMTQQRLKLDSEGLNRGYIRKGDLIRPAVLRVLRVIETPLHELNGPVLYEQDDDKIMWQDLPDNLEGFMWLQFAQAIYHRKEPRRCRECGLWFEVAGGASRTDRETCSDSCRMRGYRQRQARAVEMQAKGKTVKQIARELSSDEDTVRGWIKASRSKGE
jgi:hypothetical protein